MRCLLWLAAACSLLAHSARQINSLSAGSDDARCMLPPDTAMRVARSQVQSLASEPCLFRSLPEIHQRSHRQAKTEQQSMQYQIIHGLSLSFLEPRARSTPPRAGSVLVKRTGRGRGKNTSQASSQTVGVENIGCIVAHFMALRKSNTEDLSDLSVRCSPDGDGYPAAGM
jgi:hypothetical protein